MEVREEGRQCCFSLNVFSLSYCVMDGIVFYYYSFKRLVMYSTEQVGLGAVDTGAEPLGFLGVIEYISL